MPQCVFLLAQLEGQAVEYRFESLRAQKVAGGGLLAEPPKNIPVREPRPSEAVALFLNFVKRGAVQIRAAIADLPPGSVDPSKLPPGVTHVWLPVNEETAFQIDPEFEQAYLNSKPKVEGATAEQSRKIITA